MKEIEVELKGIGEGLLMHSAAGMTQQKPTKNPAKAYNAEDDAEAVAYRNDKKELYIPARCIKACILNAASWYKFGKNSAKPIIAGCTRLDQSEIVLLDGKGKAIKEYDIDLRPVVVQRARIIRARPLIKEWRVKFKIVYNESIIADTSIIQSILEEAGQRVGLLDNRPQKYGENGTFAVIKFLPKK